MRPAHDFSFSRSTRIICLLAALAIPAGLSSCAGVGSDPSGHSGPPGPTALFDLTPQSEPLRYDSIPFPSDLFVAVDENGVKHLQIAGLESVVPRFSTVLSQAFQEMEGFGLTTTITFRFDGDLTLSSLPADAQASAEIGSPVFLANLQPGDGSGERIPVDVHYDRDAKSLLLVPPKGAPLRPKTRYAAVVTRKVRGVNPVTGAQGEVAPSAGMLAVLDPGGHSTSDPNLSRAQAAYADPLKALLELPDIRGTGNIAAVTYFTTQAATDDLLTIRSDLEKSASPTVRFDRVAATTAELDGLLGRPVEEKPGFGNPGGLAHSNIRLVATGTYPTVWYKSKAIVEDPVAQAAARALLNVHNDDRFVHNQKGDPVPQGSRDVTFALVLPQSPPPGESAYPVSIYQHGLGGSRADLFGVANTLCGAGYAVVGIDAVEQGARFNPTDNVHNFTGASGPDGFADEDSGSTSLGVFEAFLNLLALRDNFRQTAIDQMQLVRWLRNSKTDLSAIGSPSLDGSHIFYVGNSFGSITGGIFLGIEPDVQAAFLNVGGAGLGNYLLVNSPSQGGPNLPMIATLFGIQGWCPDRFDPLINLAETIIEPGDPISYARHVVREPVVLRGGRRASPKSILAVEVIGDEAVPNPSNEHEALAMGIPLASPIAASVAGMDVVPAPIAGNIEVGGLTATAALVQYNPASHGANLDSQDGSLSYVSGFPHPCPTLFPMLEHPIDVPSPIEKTQEQMLHFFESARKGGAAEIVLTVPPVPAR